MRAVLLTFLFLMTAAAANGADLQPLPDLKTPAASDKERLSKIHDIATAWWLKNRGLLAEESIRVAGYFSIVRPIEDFAKRDDRVWEVRVIYSHSSPTGILWVNDKTGKVLGLGVEAKDSQKQAAPARLLRHKSRSPSSTRISASRLRPQTCRFRMQVGD
jgi:hypothetical protein